MAHPKGLLIERAQKLGFERPEFNTVKTGPEHEPSFLSDVSLDGELLGTGQGTSKRDAERIAAEEALAVLDRREAGTDEADGDEGAKGGAKGGRRRGGRAAGRSQRAAEPEASDGSEGAADSDDTEDEDDDTEDEDEEEEMNENFSGPWPMIDDLLASVVEVAERRVSSDLRGDAALFAIRDFSLKLYKELLADLGEVVDEDEEEEEDD